MNYFKTPKAKALLATIGSVSVLYVLIAGLITLIEHYPKYTLLAMMGLGFFWVLSSFYSMFLSKYEQEIESEEISLDEEE